MKLIKFFWLNFRKTLTVPWTIDRVASSGSLARHPSFIVAKREREWDPPTFIFLFPDLLPPRIVSLPHPSQRPYCRRTPRTYHSLDPGGELEPTPNHAPWPPPYHTSSSQTTVYPFAKFRLDEPELVIFTNSDTGDAYGGSKVEAAMDAGGVGPHRL
jgi:hypothetical protein